MYQLYHCEAAEPANKQLVQALLLPDPDRNGTEPGKLSEVRSSEIEACHSRKNAAVVMDQYHCSTEVQQLTFLSFPQAVCR